jgi:hypothetical protein
MVLRIKKLQQNSEVPKKTRRDPCTKPFILLHTSSSHVTITFRSLEQRLRLDYDSLSCWLWSVEDAQQALLHHSNQQRLHASRFFAPFYLAGRNRHFTDPDLTDSEYSPQSSVDSDTDSTSLISTDFTTTSSSFIASHITSNSTQILSLG